MRRRVNNTEDCVDSRDTANTEYSEVPVVKEKENIKINVSTEAKTSLCF